MSKISKSTHDRLHPGCEVCENYVSGGCIGAVRSYGWQCGSFEQARNVMGQFDHDGNVIGGEDVFGYENILAFAGLAPVKNF